MKQKIRINADDAGISLGVNSAIKQMALSRNLDSISVMVNGFYVQDIADFCRNHNALQVGLHLNFTTGASILGHQKLPNITHQDGTFKYGFFMLFLLAIFKRSKIITEVAMETDAQICALKSLGLTAEHLDGHRHIHFIPNIFSAVQKIANNHKIYEIRVINENVLNTLLKCRNISWIFNGNLIKLMVLRFCGLLNGSRKLQTKSYFFSILHTCKITNRITRNLAIPKKFDSMEIMIHPGNSQIDRCDTNIIYETSHLTSKNRDLEGDFIK